MIVLLYIVVYLLGAALTLYFVIAPAMLKTKKRYENQHVSGGLAEGDRQAATFFGTIGWPVALVVFGLMTVFEKGVEREMKKSR